MHVDHQNHLNRICIIIHASTHLYAQVNIHAGRVTEESATEERENVKKRKMSRRPVEGKQIAEERETRKGREECETDGVEGGGKKGLEWGEAG